MERSMLPPYLQAGRILLSSSARMVGVLTSEGRAARADLAWWSGRDGGLAAVGVLRGFV